MKRIFTLTGILFAIANMSFAQLVVTEIMYNPPESGTDSLEYIELRNNTASALNIENFSVTMAVEFTFPSLSLPAGGFVLVSESSSAMMNVFGVSAFQWNDPGALSNGGETIIVKNAAGNVIDEVAYSNTAPWPTEANGNGASLVLCDYNSDNSNVVNWSAAINNTGIIINNKVVMASPGADNQISCVFVPDVVVNATPNNVFSPKDVTINVNQSVQWKNLGGLHNVNGSTTTFPDNPESFSNGAVSSATWEYHKIFTIPGVYQYQCDQHAALGMKGTITVVDNATYPELSIVEASAVNSNGILNLIGEKCTVSGTVYGVNLRPVGLQFTIIDGENNGLAVFNNTSSFGYTVVEGDDVTIKGTLEQFNGLAQIVVTEITHSSSNNPLVSPKIVNEFIEDDESSLIKVDNLNYVDVAQWLGDGSSFNVTLTNGLAEFQIRIDNDVELSSMPAPKAPFNVTGLLGQFDSSSPYLEGYQLLPRYAADIAEVSAVQETISDLNIFPNPVKDVLNYSTAAKLKTVSVFDLLGKTLMLDQNPGGSLNLSQLNAGTYIVRFDAGERVTSKRIYKF